MSLSYHKSARMQHVWLQILAAILMVFSRPTEIPVKLTIPAINLTTTISPVGLNKENLVDVPQTHVGWYNLGPKLGEKGNLVLDGHTPGILDGLYTLNPGDKIYVNNFTYRVTNNVLYLVSKFPTKEIYGQSDGYNLILITCAGESARTVIYAKLI